MGDVPVEVALSVRAQHAEGPLWDAGTACLWWVDIAGERVHRFDPRSSEDASWATRGQPGGVVLGTRGEPVVASPEGLAILDRGTGAMDLRVPIEEARAENRANDIKVDDRGRAWVGTMALDKRPGNGALYRVEGDRVDLVVEGLTVSDGPALDASGGSCTSPTPGSASSTSSTSTRTEASSVAADATSTSPTSACGRTG